MDQNQRTPTRSSAPSHHQFHPSRASIIDIFNLYLGRSSRSRLEDVGKETPNKMQKRVTALNRELPPPNEQFLLDFERLQGKFEDQEQLRLVTETVLVTFMVQCCDHAPQADFMLFALRGLSSIGYVNWDSFLLSLLSTISSLEASGGQSFTGLAPTNLAAPTLIPSPSTRISNATNIHASNVTSTMPSISGLGLPTHSAIDQSDGMYLSPVKSFDMPGSAQRLVSQSNRLLRGNYLRKLSCKIILIGLDSNLKPVTHAEIFSHMLNWLVNWDERQTTDDGESEKVWKTQGPLTEWLHTCLDVIWMLVDEERCRIPFYELLRSGLQFLGNTPNDEALFSLMLEIHRRRDMIAMHMQMLDQHLHCPSFGTPRVLFPTHPSTSGETVPSTRHSAITYPSVLGEPLHGEDIANAIQKGSLDWERAMRCLKHALRTAPSPEWWRRVLVAAPCYRQQAQVSQVTYPGAVFSSEMVCEAVIDRTMELLNLVNSETDCWNDWLLFADICYFLIKNVGIDFLDFINKLSSRVTKDGQQTPRSNHVTWLLSQITRLDIVASSISLDPRNPSTVDPRKVDAARKMISVHKEDKSSDMNNANPQSILLDFVSSSQTLRIWSFNSLVKEYLNNDQLQKGKQIDEWWKQVNKVVHLKSYVTPTSIVGPNFGAFLVEHTKDDHLTKDRPDVKFAQWNSEDATMVTWMLYNMKPHVANGVAMHRFTKKMWESLRQMCGERMLDFVNLDDKSLGMFWVLSFTMAQPACDAIMNWLTSAGAAEFLPGSNVQPNDRMTVMRETCPLPMKLLSGLSINLCSKLYSQLEDTIFLGQMIPSIAMVETYVRLLLVAPYSIFRPHFSSLTHKAPNVLTRPGVTLLLLEILNYRLLPLYRYLGKNKALMYDVTKIIGMIKGKRGEHRTFRLAENLCMNLILSIRDFFMVKKDLKGPTEFTETLNRITVINLAITIKTRGIADVDHMVRLQPVLEQLMSTCQHTWSEKTLRHFPPVVRDFLMGRMDRKSQNIQAWQQAETTVINQCTQLLSPTADPSYASTYISHSFPQHRQYFCSGAWILMSGHPENINSANLGRVLREFSPEEVTGNIYMMVDVLLHHIQIELQHGHLLQDLLARATANLTSLVLQHELLPLDILLLALTDRDDDPYALRIVLNMLERQELQQRVKVFCSTRGSPELWLNTGVFKRNDLQKALGNHLSWKDRYPIFFDDIAARMLPVIPLIIYRLIENEATDAADRVLAVYSSFLNHHPLRFTFVRDILAYFYGHLPTKLVLRILSVLDISKIPLSESFPQHVGSSNTSSCPPMDYFLTLLLGLVNNVIPPLSNKSKPGDASGSFSRVGPVKGPTTSPFNSASSDGRRAFYQIQDPGTYTQLVLETAVIEILSLPATASQIVGSLVQVIVHVQPTLIQSNNGLLGTSGTTQSSALPTSPSGGSTESLSTTRSNTPAPGTSASSFMLRTGYSCQQLSCLMIQACGLLLAQLPVEFHLQLYSEASRVIKECWWLDGKRSARELESAIGYALLDPSWAAQENTSTAIGNIVALLHSFFTNLPQEWLESTHSLIKHLRPVTSVATLRIVFRIMGPLIPRLSYFRPVFYKIVALLFNCMADLFGRNSQTSAAVEASEITDIIDFLHHVVHYEGQGGPVFASSKPRADTLTLCGKLIDILRPDVQHLFSHLKTDPGSSIYAATHPKLAQNPT